MEESAPDPGALVRLSLVGRGKTVLTPTDDAEEFLRFKKQEFIHMITQWCVILSDVDENYFGIIGPFDTKEEVLAFSETLKYGKVGIAPTVPGWVGRVRSKELFRLLLSAPEDVTQ